MMLAFWVNAAQFPSFSSMIKTTRQSVAHKSQVSYKYVIRWGMHLAIIDCAIVWKEIRQSKASIHTIHNSFHRHD
jgi:hypothetical protein